MNIGIYNPYRKTLGGGEQYLFSYILFFLSRHHQVIYYSEDSNEIEKAQKRFGFNLNNLLIHPPVFDKGNWYEKAKETTKLDLFLFYSDGSIPTSFAKKNYLIFQFPVPWVSLTPLQRLKMKRVAGVLVNSNFTKRFIDKNFGTSSQVVYPSIDLSQYHQGKKEKVIISVGRFTKGMNTKKHDVLIDVFKKMVDEGIKGWKLVIAGGVLSGDEDEVIRLKKIAEGYSIIFKPNCSQEELKTLYSTASFYWHAAGYAVDEDKHPEQVEHFGISTLEGMASKAVPLVYPAGGQKEIIEEEVSGVFWRSQEDLCKKTIDLIQNPKAINKLEKGVQQRILLFDRSHMFQTLGTIFHQTL